MCFKRRRRSAPNYKEKLKRIDSSALARADNFLSVKSSGTQGSLVAVEAGAELLFLSFVPLLVGCVPCLFVAVSSWSFVTGHASHLIGGY